MTWSLFHYIIIEMSSYLIVASIMAGLVLLFLLTNRNISKQSKRGWVFIIVSFYLIFTGISFYMSIDAAKIAEKEEKYKVGISKPCNLTLFPNEAYVIPSRLFTDWSIEFVEGINSYTHFMNYFRPMDGNTSVKDVDGFMNMYNIFYPALYKMANINTAKITETQKEVFQPLIDLCNDGMNMLEGVQNEKSYTAAKEAFKKFSYGMREKFNKFTDLYMDNLDAFAVKVTKAQKYTPYEGEVAGEDVRSAWIKLEGITTTTQSFGKEQKLQFYTYQIGDTSYMFWMDEKTHRVYDVYSETVEKPTEAETKNSNKNSSKKNKTSNKSKDYNLSEDFNDWWADDFSDEMEAEEYWDEYYDYEENGWDMDEWE